MKGLAQLDWIFQGIYNPHNLVGSLFFRNWHSINYFAANRITPKGVPWQTTAQIWSGK
jgi:hypothetical protein